METAKHCLFSSCKYLIGRPNNLYVRGDIIINFWVPYIAAHMHDRESPWQPTTGDDVCLMVPVSELYMAIITSVA